MGKGKINSEVSFKSLQLSYRQKMKLNIKDTQHSYDVLHETTAPPPLDLKYFNKCVTIHFYHSFPRILNLYSRSQEAHLILFVTATMTLFSNCNRDLTLEDYCCGN